MVEYQKSAGVLVYCDDNGIKFLLLKYKTYWGFVKGLIEGGEGVVDAAVRELGEETGIKNVKIIPGFEKKQEWFFRAEGKLVRKKAIYFLVKVSKEAADKVKISHEHEEFAWLSYDDAIEKMKIKANKELLKKAYDFIKEYEKQGKLS